MNRRKFLKTSACFGAVAACSCLCGCNFNSRNSDDRFKLKSTDDLPRIVRLEACNDCQLNCAACWMRADEQEIIKKAGGFGYLKFEDFKNFVDEYDFIEEIELSNNGEIFLNPELDDIIKYAYEKGIRLAAANGVNLNTVSDETLENLVKYKFFCMTVSIDGATPEVYSIYRRGGDFNTVINNIRKINKFKEQYGSDHPYLAYQFILFGHNEHEIDAAKALAQELNMNIVFQENYVKDYSPLKNPKLVQEKTGLNLLGDDKEKEAQMKNESELLCYQLEESPQINFNGDLLGCCVLHTRTFKANVFKEGFLEALNSPMMLKAKHMLADFSVEPDNSIPCATCEEYINLKRQNQPLKFKVS